LPELLKMKKCPQPKNWHSEGDVWQHTVLCLQNLFSRQYQKKFPEKPSINLILATLFHDSGKPYTIQTPKKDHTDRIRFNDHDNFGAQLARKAGERLKLSAYKDSAIDCDPEQVSWLIAKHMLVVHGRVGEMKNTTLEKYFFSDRPGADLLRLIFVDTLATVPGKGEKYTPHYPALEKRVKQLARLGSIKKPALPAPILDGREIMKLCKIKPGPEVGRIILKLREEQLKGRIRTKAAAKKFIRIKN
ncbi:MAG: HD domain-containing protein, partial [Patescibacteria group bacterium]